MTKPQKIVLECAALVAGAVALFPPLCLVVDNNGDDAACISYGFMFRLPPLNNCIWSATLFLMLVGWLLVFVLAFFAYRVAGRYNKSVFESSPWGEPQNDNPTIWPPPPSV